MRRPLAAFALAVLLAASPAWSASAVDAARQTASAARAKVNELRSQQLSMRMELNRVATRIETLKANQKGALLPGSELETSLRRSQELSSLLTSAAQSLSSAEAELEKHNLLLLDALNRELDGLRAQWDRLTDRGARQAVVQKMRSLRQERDQVRAMLPAAKVPALGNAHSDDPEDLLEQADALRDTEDKVRQKMKALQSRITELREEQELDRRMSDFMGDESMFDEQDRRLRRERTKDMAQARQPPLFGAPAEDAAAAPEAGAGGEFTGSPPQSEPTRDTTAEPTTGTTSSPVLITQIARGVDARPQVSGSVDALLLEGGEGQTLEALEAQLKKLGELAKKLDARAEDMEKRANELQ